MWDLDRIRKKTREERTLCFQADGAAYHKYCDEDNDPGGSGLVRWHSYGDFNNPDDRNYREWLVMISKKIYAVIDIR